MPSEFELIANYFTRPPRHAVLGVGDDAALIAVSHGHELAASTDMLVEGVHFFPDVSALALGYKALAVNLSDLAAMGATPKWAMLALSLPAADAGWVRDFAAGFFSLAERHDVDLIGGDTTRGPRNICVQVMGEVAQGRALRRDGAKPGDDVWLSGHVGDAAAAVAHRKGELLLREPLLGHCQARLDRPTPRVELGLRLAGLASSAIDISDGLIADLGHTCERSRVGADVEFAADPLFCRADAAQASCAGDPGDSCGRRRLRTVFHRRARKPIPDRLPCGKPRPCAEPDRQDHRRRRGHGARRKRATHGAAGKGL